MFASATTAFLMAIILSGSVNAEIQGGILWCEKWHNYPSPQYVPDGMGQQNLTAHVITVRDPQGLGYIANMSFDVAVFQYQPFFGPLDSVNFETNIAICTQGPPGFDVFPFAEYVYFYIEKDLQPGSNKNNQYVNLVLDDQTPGFSQGYRLQKDTPYPHMDDQPLNYWALKCLQIAVGGLFALPLAGQIAYEIALGLISQATSYTTGSGYCNAGRADTFGCSIWNRQYGYPITSDPVKQYCHDSWQWFQDQSVEPSTYYGLKVYADVVLTDQARTIFNIPAGHIMTTTLELKINNRTYYPGGGEGRCPTLFVRSSSGFVDYGVIDIHNPSGEDVTSEVPIRAGDVAVQDHMANLRLREGWPELHYSESVIDQVRLYGIDNYGNRFLCPLISAEHCRLGNVLPQLLRSDNHRVQIYLMETIDLTFVVPRSQAIGFTFLIEGCNQFKT